MDKITTEKRRMNMQNIHSKNTNPEITVRRWIHKKGYRFRVNVSELPGKPDITFGGRKKVIFVHGCFWHSHMRKECIYNHIPQSRQEYWIPKLKKTIERDKENELRLKELGWKCLIIWECETKKIETLSEKIEQFIGPLKK
jgi:DNA mismatch endonuclease, patch repair protein